MQSLSLEGFQSFRQEGVEPLQHTRESLQPEHRLRGVLHHQLLRSQGPRLPLCRRAVPREPLGE